MPHIFNTHLRQIFIFSIILMLGILLVATLYDFLPGLLGSITLYILTKKLYTKLTIEKKWKEGLTAILFISILILLIAVPLYFFMQFVIPKINNLLNNPDEIISRLEKVSKKVESYLGKELFTPATATDITKQITAYIPLILNTSANLVMNFVMMFFFLFYLLYSNKAIECYLKKTMPFSNSDTRQLGDETIMMVRANALGIPIVSIVQGCVATIGYLIFGVDNWALWGFFTGVFAFFPILGIMVIYIPLVIYYYSIDQNYIATGVALYSVFITGNVDYIARLVINEKIGNVHPMITVLGVILGLKLFGFMGLIFGPLLISYFIILIKFYTKEFIVPNIKKDNDEIT